MEDGFRKGLRSVKKSALLTLCLLVQISTPAFADAVSDAYVARAKVRAAADKARAAAREAISAAKAAEAAAKAAVAADVRASNAAKAAERVADAAADKAASADASAKEAKAAAADAAKAAANHDCPAAKAAAARAAAAAKAAADAYKAVYATKDEAAAKAAEAAPYLTKAADAAKAAAQAAAAAKVAYQAADAASIEASNAAQAAWDSLDDAGDAFDAAIQVYQARNGTQAAAEAASRADSAAAQANADATADAKVATDAAKEVADAVKAAQDAVVKAAGALRSALRAANRAEADADAAAKSAEEACSPPKCTCSCDDIDRYNRGLFTGDKESVACVKSCAEKEAKEKKCPRPRKVAVTGGAAAKRWMLSVIVGGDLELHNEPHQAMVGGLLGYAVMPDRRGYVVFVPEVKTNGNLTTVSVPFGFQYEFRLPVPGLFVYPRVTLGYAASIVTFTFSGRSITSTANLGVVTAVAGIKYVLHDRWSFALEPLGLTTFFGANGATLSWRLAAAAGINF